MTRQLRHWSLPFLALLAAATLILLTPSSAPANYTEGRLSIGSGSSALTVAVFADVMDAQDGVASGVAASGSITSGDAAYIAGGADPRNTFSNNDLYVSNQTGAYNTVLITATVAGLADGACAEATVFNRDSRESVTVLLAPTGETPVDGAHTYQGVVDLAERDTENADGPACDAYTAGTDALAVLRSVDRDRLAVSVRGVSSSIELIVDAEGPEFRVFSPAPDSYLPSVLVNFSFDVRDDGAGLRHDGEFEISGDGDPRPVNPDGDQVTSNEPLSTTDGASEEIHAYLSREGGDTIDVTAYGSNLWRAIDVGTAYALSVEVNVGGSGTFNLEFEATDRTGNTTIVDAADAVFVDLTPTPTPTPPGGIPPTPTPMLDPFPTATPTGTLTPTPTPDGIPTATPTGTGTPTPSATPDSFPTATPTPSGTVTPTPTSPFADLPTATPTPSGTITPTPISPLAGLPTATPTPSGTITPTPAPGFDAVPTATPFGRMPTPTAGGIVPTPTPTPTVAEVNLWLEAWRQLWQAWLLRLLGGFFG